MLSQASFPFYIQRQSVSGDNGTWRFLLTSASSLPIFSAALTTVSSPSDNRFIIRFLNRPLRNISGEICEREYNACMESTFRRTLLKHHFQNVMGYSEISIKH